MNNQDFGRVRCLFPDPRNRGGFDMRDEYATRFGTHVARWLPEGMGECGIHPTAAAGVHERTAEVDDDTQAPARADELEIQTLLAAEQAGETFYIDLTEAARSGRGARLVIGEDGVRMSRERHERFGRTPRIEPWPFREGPAAVAATLDGRG